MIWFGTACLLGVIGMYTYLVKSAKEDPETQTRRSSLADAEAWPETDTKSKAA